MAEQTEPEQTEPLMNSPNDSSSSTMASVASLMNSAKEKWVSSGGKDAFDRVSASIPDSTKSYVGGLFNRDQLRTIAVCIGTGEERPFYIEKTPSLIMYRMRTNVNFFFLNYMLLTAVLFGLTLLVSPGAIIGIGLLALAWMALAMGLIRSLQIAEMNISQKTATQGMAAVSFCILLYLLSGIFWWTLLSSGFLIAVHAFLRNPAIRKDMDSDDDAVDLESPLDAQEESTSKST